MWTDQLCFKIPFYLQTFQQTSRTCSIWRPCLFHDLEKNPFKPPQFVFSIIFGSQKTQKVIKKHPLLGIKTSKAFSLSRIFFLWRPFTPTIRPHVLFSISCYFLVYLSACRWPVRHCQTLCFWSSFSDLYHSALRCKLCVSGMKCVLVWFLLLFDHLENLHRQPHNFTT